MLFVVVVVVSSVVVVVISNVKEAVVRARSTKAITDEYFLNAKSRKKNCRVREKKRSYFFVRRRKPTPKRPKVFYLGFVFLKKKSMRSLFKPIKYSPLYIKIA